MNNTRKIARQLFYTDKCDILPTEEEERELNIRYGMKYPYKNKFNSLVDEYTSEEQEELSSSTTKIFTASPFTPYSRLFLSEIVDEIDDEYNLDVDNLDANKYERLEVRFEEIKKQIWRKIMLSKLPDPVKTQIGRGIDKSKNFLEMYSFLLLKVSML